MASTTPPRPVAGSVRSVLLIALLLGAALPFPSLALVTWRSYRADLARVEETIQAGNRQISRLATEHMEAMLRDAANEARFCAPPRGDGRWLPREPPGVEWEWVDGRGVARASSLSSERVGRTARYASVLDPSAPLREVRATMVADWVPPRPRSFLLVMRADEDLFLVGYVDPVALRARLTGRSDDMLDRHVYAVDREGNVIFYAAFEVGQAAYDLRSNPPAALVREGREGELRFQSVVSGKERLGFVQRVAAHGVGIIVSADVGARVVDLRERYDALLLAIGFAMVVTLGVFFYASHRLVRPLLRVREAVAASGPPSFEPLLLGPEVRRLREFDELVRAFDDLALRYRQTESQLVQAEKVAVTAQLASGIAHEIGTPLGVIKGAAQYLLRRFGAEEPAARDLTLIVQQTERIATLVRQVLHFSRPSEAHRAPLSLGDVVVHCLEMTSPLVEGVDVELDIDPDTPPVFGDARLLEHAVLNLVVNALQAMPKGGRLTLTVGLSTPLSSGDVPWVCCRVADTGVGVPPEHLSRIFEPFFTTKPQGKGTGLGLALVDRILRQHDATVQVVSAPGRGTVFTLRFHPSREGSTSC